MTRKSRTVEEDHPWSTYAGTPPIHGRLRDFLDMLWCLAATGEVRFFGCADGARAGLLSAARHAGSAEFCAVANLGQ